MDQYELIRKAHRVYGKNVSKLSKMTGHSRDGQGDFVQKKQLTYVGILIKVKLVLCLDKHD